MTICIFLSHFFSFIFWSKDVDEDDDDDGDEEDDGNDNLAKSMIVYV